MRRVTGDREGDRRRQTPTTVNSLAHTLCVGGPVIIFKTISYKLGEIKNYGMLIGVDRETKEGDSMKLYRCAGG